MVDISARSYLSAGMALTAASAIAFTPLVVPDAASPAVTVPHIAAPRIDLAAVVTPAEITALVNNLDVVSGSAAGTVASLAAVRGQTLVGALNSAAAVNNALWDGLIAATDSAILVDVLWALKAASNGGLARLASTVESMSETITLTSGEVADLLTSTLTGSLGTAQHAVATLITNPLSVSSYTGLVNVPVDLAGLALTGGLAAARELGVSAFGLGDTLVRGVTAQITNALAAVNNLIDTAKGVPGSPLVAGLVTAVQAIASAPVTVGVAGVNGLTGALTAAGSTVWTRVTNGAAAAVSTWLGNGVTQGAVQAAINEIGNAPLSPASYTNTLSVLVGAGVTTLNIGVGTVSSLASVPFSASARLTTTGADMMKEFNSSLATAAAGIMQAAGLPSLVYNLPHVMAAGVNGAITVAALATSAGLNGIASAIDLGNTLTGAMPTQRSLTVNVASDAPLAADEVSAESTSSDPAADASETGVTDAKKGDTSDTSAAVEPESIEPPEPEGVTTAEEPAAATDATKSPLAQEVSPSAATTTESGATGGATEDASTDPDAETAVAASTHRGDESVPDETAAPSRESTAADDPATTVPDHRKQPRSEPRAGVDSGLAPASKTDPDRTRDEAGPRTGTTGGGKHTQGNVKNPASVSEIKNRLDKEATEKASNSAFAASESSEAA